MYGLEEEKEIPKGVQRKRRGAKACLSPRIQEERGNHESIYGKGRFFTAYIDIVSTPHMFFTTCDVFRRLQNRKGHVSQRGFVLSIAKVDSLA